MKQILLIAALLIASLSMASDKNGYFNVNGTGGASCGSYIDELNKKNDNSYDSLLHYAYKNWMSGYITAYNEFTPETYNILGNTDKTGVYAFVEKYCRENPLKDFIYAVIALTDELHSNRQRNEQ